MKKRTIALWLAAAMLFSLLCGCGGGNGNENNAQQPDSTGRFIETELTLPDGIDEIRTMAKLEDGSLEAIGMSHESYYIIHSTDMGETWETTPLLEIENEYIDKPAIAPDGTAALFALDFDDEGDSFTYTLKLASPQGEIQEIPLPDMKDMLSHAEYDSAGNLFALSTSGRLIQINTETGTCSQPFDAEDTMFYYFGIASEKLCAVHDKGVLLFDTVTKKSLSTEGALDQVITNSKYSNSIGYDRGVPMIFTGGTEDSILIVNHEGIFQHAMGGSVNEQLADGSQTSLSDINLVFISAVMPDEDHIIISAFDGEGNDKLLCYTYDSEASAVPENEITLYALNESAMVRQAAIAFQKNHPDTHVNVEIGISSDNGVTVEDALKVLNTNIMAGKGPDVLILDDMPLDSYIEKGVLEDISDVVNEVEQEDGFFENIKNAYVKDGKQYAMPVRFYTSIVIGDPETVAAGNDWGKLADRAQALQNQNPEKPVLLSKSPIRVLYEMYRTYSGSWTSNTLKDLLTQAKRFYDMENHDEELNMDASNMINGSLVGTAGNQYILTKMCQFDFGTWTDLFQMQELYSAQPQTGSTFGLLGTTFTPYLLAGVVSGGNTDTAKQFVKELLGKTLNTNDHDGIPVNRAAYDAVCQDQMSETGSKVGLSLVTSMDNGETKYSIEYIALTQENVDTYTKMLESLTQPSITDRVIQDLVLEQGEKYLKGTQDLDTTVSEIEKKLNLYLAE